jgi:predicted MFS family arabinose efflux permease
MPTSPEYQGLDMEGTTEAAARGRVRAWRVTGAALCASLLGLGLARFGYTPLVPVLVAAGWFSAGQAFYLGASNLAGYLAGALLARRLAHHLSLTLLLRAAMLLAALSFIGCAWPLSFAWYFIWRFASGFAGGVLMAVAAPAVLPHVPAARRGLAGGVIFAGLGMGIVLSGTVLPPLLELGLRPAWLALGALGLALTALSWREWPDAGRSVARHPQAGSKQAGRAQPRRSPEAGALRWLYAAYALNAVGLVPHMLFLADFVVRGGTNDGLGLGLAAGARAWVVFGVGALAGSLMTGALADRIGFARALRASYPTQAAGVALALVAAINHSGGGTLVMISAFVVGAFVPGIVSITLGRVRELASPDASGRTPEWGLATSAWAVGQAVAAYGMSFLLAHRVGYSSLFAISIAALLLALVVDVAAPSPVPAQSPVR